MRMQLVGDVMLGRLVNQVLRGWPPEKPWGDTLPVFQQADWSFCNLECVISGLAARHLQPKTFRFRSDQKNVEVLQAAGINAVSLANNHCLDFGAEAMLDMISTLDASGIGHAGAGVDLELAMRPALSSSKDGTRVGVLACTDNEPDWAAGPDKPGVWFVPAAPEDSRAQELLEGVRRLRRATDIACVSLHWGSNWGRMPEPGHRELAHALVDAGADVVFGHSCHVVRGIEVRKGSLIVYSAGNFIDDYAVDPEERNDESFVFGVEVQHAELVRLELIPTLIGECQATLARGPDRTRILKEMCRQCARLGSKIIMSERESTIALRPSLAAVTHG